jgi:hypothetical protein
MPARSVTRSKKNPFSPANELANSHVAKVLKIPQTPAVNLQLLRHGVERRVRKRGGGHSTRAGREYAASFALVNLAFGQYPHMFSASGAQSELRNTLLVEAWQTSGLERTSRNIGLSEPGHNEHHR